MQDSKKDDYHVLKENFKTLKRAFKQERDKTQQLNDELTNIRTQLAKKNDEFESLQINYQGQTQRIALLQKEKEQASSKQQSSWGGFFGAGGGASREQYDELENQLKLVSEDLETKMQETAMVHMKITDLKREYLNKIDELESQLQQNLSQIKELEENITNKNNENLSLTQQLKDQKEATALLEQKVKQVQQDYEHNKEEWQKKEYKLQYEINEKTHESNQFMPFNPFHNNKYNIINTRRVNKDNVKKQDEAIVFFNAQVTSLQKQLEQQFQILRNYLDGQIPVGDKLSSQVMKFQKYISKFNFLEEQIGMFNQNQDAKQINDSIRKSIANIKHAVNSLFETSQNTFTKEGVQTTELAHYTCQISDNILQIKTEFQNISKQFKRKHQLIKEDKLMFQKIETKSNNLKLLGEDLISQFHQTTSAFDQLHQAIIQIKTTFIVKELDHQGKQKSHYFSLSLGQHHYKNQQGQQIQQQIGQLLPLIPYEEALNNKQKIQIKEQEITQLSQKMHTSESEIKLYKEQLKRIEEVQIRLKTQSQINKQDKEEIMEATSTWLAEFFMDVEQYEKDQEPSALNQELQVPLKSLKLKLNILSDQLGKSTNQPNTSKTPKSISKTESQLSTVKNQVSQDLKNDLYLFEDVYHGLQKLSIQLSNTQSTSQNPSIIPLNHYSQMNSEQKLAQIQEKSLQKVLQMCLKLHNLNKMSQGSNLQVIEKDREWKSKYDNLKSQLEQEVNQLKTQLESAINDKQVITSSYEEQMKMMSEHLVEMQTQINQSQS
eukprot:403342220